MKRVFCILAALALAAVMCACGGDNKENDTSSASGTVERYASQGVIPEVSGAIGMSPDKIKQLYPAHNEGEDFEEEESVNTLLSELEGQLAVCLVTPNASFYYEKSQVDSGISVIAVMGGSAYGLEVGSATKSDVNALMGELKQSTATDEQQYFLPVSSDVCEILTCDLAPMRLDFFINDGYLTAVTLTDTDHWTD